MESELYDTAFGAFWYTTGTFSVLINMFFLFLIIFKSPQSLTPYKVLLGNSAITDLVFSISTTFLQCRIIPNKWAFAYVALGPAKNYGEQIAYYTYVLQLHSLFYLFLCFPLSFGFRYYVLIRPVPSMKQLAVLLFFVWLLPLTQSICFINSQSDSTAIREYLRENRPEYNLTGDVVTGNHLLWQPLTAVTLASIVLPMFPIYILIVFFFRRVNSYLDRRDSGLELQAATKRGHKRLIKALAIQASLPLFFVFPPITVYLAYHLELIHATMAEYLVYSIFSIMPAVSPVVSMYFIRPYYLWIRRRRNALFRLPPPLEETNVAGGNRISTVGTPSMQMMRIRRSVSAMDMSVNMRTRY